MKDLVPANIRFQSASDRSLLVHFGQEISLDIHREIVSFLKLLEAEPLNGVVNLHPAYCSVLVKFDALKLTHQDIEAYRERARQEALAPGHLISDTCIENWMPRH
jgi:allophanate hydrolase subunit 1